MSITPFVYEINPILSIYIFELQCILKCTIIWINKSSHTLFLLSYIFIHFLLYQTNFLLCLYFNLKKY